MTFEYELMTSTEEVRQRIRECEGRHVQQAIFSTFMDTLTQVCFTCVTLTWETRPADVCQQQGHLWGGWFPYEEPIREDISDVLMGALLGGGRLEVITKPTKERRCTRCGAHDNNGVTKWHRGTLETNLLGNIKIGAEFTTPALTWADDKLNPSE